MSDDYDVGYGKPPVEHRWKKGEPSPNQAGRPRTKLPIRHVGSRQVPQIAKNDGQITDFASELTSPGMLGGQEVQMSVSEQALFKLAMNGAKGDIESADKYFRSTESIERAKMLKARRKKLEAELQADFEPLWRTQTFAEKALMMLGVLEEDWAGRLVISEHALDYIAKNTSVAVNFDMLVIMELAVANPHQLHRLYPIRNALTWREDVAEEMKHKMFADYTKWGAQHRRRIAHLEELERKEKEKADRAKRRVR